MYSWRKSRVLLAFALFTASASAAPIVYVVTSNQQFGTLNLGTGAFSQIGPNTPEGSDGLVQGPNATLLTLTYSGKLDSINEATGVTTVIGATGLADCSLPSSPCGPTSASALAEVGGKIYATDFQNDLYNIDPLTGVSTLIGPTGIPPVTFVPFGSPNPDGTFNFFGGGLFNANGNLYATFDTGTENPTTGAITPVIADTLYRIDPLTGKAVVIAPTDFSLDTVVSISGTVYAFKNSTSQLETLNLSNGGTTLLANLDPSVGLVFGAVATPEPASIGLALLGIAAFGANRLRRRR